MARSMRRKPMSQINVVPYIDVMLVLLVIFMVTAPLLTQGIKVDLPEAVSESMDVQDPDQLLVVTIKKDGSLYLNVGDEDRALDIAGIGAQAGKILKANPSVQVLIEADRELPYGSVINVMNVLQQSGAPSVGLVTEPPEA